MPAAARAQGLPTPGLAIGTVEGTAFEVPLDCRYWDYEPRMVFSVGENRGVRDLNGDRVGLFFSHLKMSHDTDSMIWFEGRELALNGELKPNISAPQWDVGDNNATFVGLSAGIDSAEVNIVIDCGAWSDGLTGRVSGTIDGHIVDESLYCGNWDRADVIEAHTEDAYDIIAELSVIRASKSGTIKIDTDAETYQIIVGPIEGTEFQITDDRVSFVADLTQLLSGSTYSVDLKFDCSVR